MNAISYLQNTHSSFEPITHRYYYAAYLNSAVNNLENVGDAFCNHFGVKKPIGVKIFNNIISRASMSELDYKHYVEFIAVYFPLINQLGENYKERLTVFNQLCNKINDCRNYFTHYYHDNLVLDKSLFRIIDGAILHAIIKTKKGRMKMDATRQVLSSSQKENFDLLVSKCKMDLLEGSKALKELANEEKDVKIKNDLKKKSKAMFNSSNRTEELENGVLNNSFKHLIDSSKGEVMLKETYSSNFYNRNNKHNDIYVELESKLGISINGLIFLMCSFLSKKEGEEFRSKLRFFKAKNNADQYGNLRGLEFMATHWVFSYYAFKGIKQRLNTTFVGETLLSQMVDKLSKVPNEVYDNLSAENRKQFVEDLNEFIDIREDGDVIDFTPVIRKRYEDKFIYFALRYLDEYAGFQKLRFQIRIGEYVSDRRVKPIPGLTESVSREVKNRINVFCKLSEAIDAKNTYFENVTEENQDSLGWRPYPNPSYNVVNNNIPINIEDGVKNILGEIDEGKNKNTLQLLVGESNKFTHTKPMIMLSIYEIPALLYELLQKKTNPQKIEKILINRFRTKVLALKKSQFTSEDGVPRVVSRSDTEQAIRINQKMIDDVVKEMTLTRDKTDWLKNRLEPIVTELGKRKTEQTIPTLKSYEKGDIARWLADDIKRFMPERDIWKSYLHNQLQLCLAVGRHTDALNLLKLYFGKFSKYNKFIQNSLWVLNFESMYRIYLEGRLDYFSDLKFKLESGNPSGEVLKRFYQFFNPRFYNNAKSKQYMAEQLLNHPLVFPRGLFDAKPTVIEGKSPLDPKFKDEFADWYSYALSFDAYQTFYGLNLDYVDNYKNCFDLDKNQLVDQESRKYLKFKVRQDKAIRRVKMHDVFMKLMVESMYEKIFSSPLDLSLSTIYKSRAERLDEQKRVLSQSLRKKENKEENLIRESNYWDTLVNVVLIKGESNQFKIKLFDKETSIPNDDNVVLKDKNIKIKDVGRYKYFINDEKVKCLLSLQNLSDISKFWTKQLVDEELQYYTQIRSETIFDLLHKVECELLMSVNFDGKHYPTAFMNGDDPNFKLGLVNGFLKEDLATKEDIEKLKKCGGKDFEKLSFYESLNTDWAKTVFMIVLIRNKFSHNQYPALNFMQLIVQTINKEMAVEKPRSYAEYILEYLKIQCKKIYDKMAD